MTIEIEQPELVALIEKRMQEENFVSVDAMLIELAYFGFRSGEVLPPARKRRNLVEACEMVRGLTEDLDFSRDPSLSRDIDLG